MNSLPEGLVMPTGGFSANLAGFVDDTDIARLWRVYNTNPRVHQGTTGYRLENLFWRIWGSALLLGSLDGSTLARLFQLIVEDRPWGGEQTTPKPSGTRLPSILKKQHSPQPDLPKTTRLLLPGPEGQSFTRSPSNPLTPIPPARRTSSEMSSKQKKMLVAANTMARTVKRRPAAVPRGKSSRSRPVQTQIHTPQDTSPQGTDVWVDLSDDQPDELSEETITPTNENTKAQLPASFVADLREQMRAHPAERPDDTDLQLDPFTNPQATDTELWYGWYRQPSKTKLVDKSFRSRFAEQVDEMREGMHGAQVTESDSGIALGNTIGESMHQPVHAAGHNESRSFDVLSMTSGSCAILTASSGDIGTSGPGRSFNATPGSNEMSSYEGVPTEAVPTPSGSGSQIRMDTTFEELEELSPMVW